MDRKKISSPVITTGHFPYPGEWLDAQSEEIARSIAKWADAEVIGKRLESREVFEYQMRVLKMLATTIGLHRLILPEKYGGVGLSIPEAASTLVRAYEEIGRADPGIGFISAMNMVLAAVLINSETVADDVKRDIGSALCSMDEVKLFSLVLPGVGDVSRASRGIISGREVQATVSNEGNGWLLNAKEARPLNSGYDASMYAVIAESNDGFALVLVPAGEAQVEKGVLLKTTGLLASRNADVTFSNVKVSHSCVISQGESMYKQLMTWICLLTGAIAVGSAMDVYALVKNWADTRVIKGKGLFKDNPVDAAVLAQVAMDIINSRLLVHVLARAVAKPDMFGIMNEDALLILAESVSIKVMDGCMHGINRAMEMMGSAGYAKEWNVEKHWRDIRTMQVYLGGRTPVEMDVARVYYGSSGI